MDGSSVASSISTDGNGRSQGRENKHEGRDSDQASEHVDWLSNTLEVPFLQRNNGTSSAFIEVDLVFSRCMKIFSV